MSPGINCKMDEEKDHKEGWHPSESFDLLGRDVGNRKVLSIEAKEGGHGTCARQSNKT